jgi:general secretion pathway protein N
MWSAGRIFSLSGLLLASLGLGAVVYGELNGDAASEGIEATAGDAAAPSAAARPVAAANLGQGFSLPPLGSFAVVTERPLFSASRRPPPPQASQEAIRQSGTLALEGVILLHNQRLALISHGRPPTLVRVPEGQEIEGWTVVSIRPDGIVLQRDATRQELKLVDKPTPTRQPKPPLQVAPKP